MGDKVQTPHPGTDNEGSYHCSVCREDGETTPAARWCPSCKAAFCNNCLRLHNRMPISRFHDVHPVSESEDIDMIIRFMCPTHIDEDITLYCRDCKEPICQPCRQRIHFICRNVVKLQEMLPEVRANLRDKKAYLQSEIARREDIISKRKAQLKLLREFSSKTEAQIKDTCMEAMNVIKTKEQDLLGRLDAGKLRVGGFDTDDAYDVFPTSPEQQPSRKLESREDGVCYERYELMRPAQSSESKSSESSIKSGGDDKLPRVACNTQNIYDAIKTLDLWHLDSVSLGVADLASTPVLRGTLDTKTYKDKDDPILKDILVMDVNGIRTIVVSNLNIRTIKSFYTQHNKRQQSILELKERPNSMTVAEGNQIIATTPFSFQIHKISVYPDLRLSSSISTMFSYYGITYIGQNRLIACVRDSIWKETNKSQLHIIDMKGNMLKSIPVSGIQSPDFAFFTGGGDILLSDVYTKIIVSMSTDGQVHFTSKCEEPAGVIPSTSGYILAVDRNKGTVVQMDSKGHHVRDVLTSENGISDTYGIFMDSDESLFVTSGRYIKVFGFE